MLLKKLCPSVTYLRTKLIANNITRFSLTPININQVYSILTTKKNKYYTKYTNKKCITNII